MDIEESCIPGIKPTWSWCMIFLMCCWKRLFATTSVFSWQNSVSLCTASFCTPRPNLPLQFNSVQFSHSAVSDSLRPHEPQHARPPCPSPTPRVYPKSCPLSRRCHPTISVIPFSSYPQSFPASGPFQMSQFFASGGQSIGVPASASVLPKNTQD